MIINIKATLAVLVLSLGLAGCGQSSDGGDHDHGAGEDHAAHDAPERDALVYTHYSDTTELFVQFPTLVAGRGSTFAAHVTRLADYAPLDRGTLDVLLLDGERTAARFRVEAPSRTGIFTPVVTPREAGEYRLVIQVRRGDLRARHDLGPVTVFPDTDSVAVEQPAPEGGVTYLKEQQWDNAFAAEAAAQRPLRPSVPGFATVLAPADTSATVRAPSDGYFTATTIRAAGETVAAKALLGHLIPRLGEATDVGELSVELERARSRVKLAKRDLERLESLLKQGAIPEKRVVEARQELEVARVELRAARSRLEQQSGTDGESGIALRSPLAGELVSVSVRPGAYVQRGDALFTIADPDRRWLEVRVPEKFATDVDATTGAWLEVENGDRPRTVVFDADHGARVVHVDSTIAPRSRTASVTIDYPADRGPSLIGARYPARVLTGSTVSRLAIPRSAVIDDGGQPVVYVQTGGETFDRRAVQLGIADGNYVEVIDGVRAGERVASRGAYYVKLAASGGNEIGHGHAH